MDITKTYCDIQGCLTESAYMAPRREVQVIMLTEDTEGRASDPWRTHHDLDICDEHYALILQGHPIFAEGAQGHNKYRFGTCPTTVCAECGKTFPRLSMAKMTDKGMVHYEHMANLA
jgi:hypothetical protein